MTPPVASARGALVLHCEAEKAKARDGGSEQHLEDDVKPDEGPRGQRRADCKAREDQRERSVEERKLCIGRAK